MITKLFCHIFLFGVVTISVAQSIQIDPLDNPITALPITELVETIVIDRDNIQLIPSSVTLIQNNATATSALKSWGYFNSNGSTFPFEEGIVLTTGSAQSAVGPNDDTEISSGNTAWVGDADLRAILNADNVNDRPTFNATSLQFDFIPNGTALEFDFIFASEEYENDFECNQDGALRDGFAFLIKGPGIPNDSGTSFGGTNIAAIPGSSGVPVNTGSIHINTNPDGSLFRCPDRSGGVGPFPDIEELGVNFFPELYVSNPPGTETIQYDGYTTVIPASVTVIPRETYTLKLVIGDRGDDEVDSAVFIRGLSASANVIIENTSGPTPISEDLIICTDELPQTLTARFVTTPFSGSETYVWRRNDIVIAGATTNSIVITEGGAYSVSVTDLGINIRDSIDVTLSRGPETLELSLSSSNLTEHTIIATATGEGTLRYSLDNGTPQESAEFSNVSTGQHSVTVSDLEGCGSITKNIFVTGFPKYFTPNGDGFHDTWNAVGEQDLSLITITVFDRFGKFIATFRADRTGWDGMYNGAMMPSSEYWFKAIMPDGQQFTGHFSLIR